MKTVRISPTALPLATHPRSPSGPTRQASSHTPVAPRSPRFASGKPPRPPSPRVLSAARNECTPNAVRQRSPDAVQRRVAQLLDAYLERALGPVGEDGEDADDGTVCDIPAANGRDTVSKDVEKSVPKREDGGSFRLFADSTPGKLVIVRKRPAPADDLLRSPRNVADGSGESPRKRVKRAFERVTEGAAKTGSARKGKVRGREWEIEGDEYGQRKKICGGEIGNGVLGKIDDDGSCDSESDDDADEIARLRSVVVSIVPPVVSTGDR